MKQCKNCGAEMLPEYRFCRVCGTASGQLAVEEAPTRMMPGRAPGRESASQPQSEPLHYQSTLVQQAHTLPHQPARRRSVGRWIFGFAALGICCFVLLGALFFFIGGRHWRRPARPGLPPPPPPVAQTDEAALGEEGAEITGDKTVITRAFPLGARARVMVENLNGDITLEGWDQPRAEVKVTKRGGSADDRRAVPVEFSRDEDELSLKTEAGRNSGVNVTYEIKVPRNLGEVKINATNSSIKLANIEGLFEVETRNGSINLVDVSGAAQAKTTNGSIKAAFKQIAPDEPLELEGVNGSIELRTGGDVNADLEAQTITGTITLDDSFGVRVEKRLVGQKADGRLGEGGRPITVKTVNGSIKITK